MKSQCARPCVYVCVVLQARQRPGVATSMATSYTVTPTKRLKLSKLGIEKLPS